MGGTLRWQAPELFREETEDRQPNRKASDIYAFACVCYEVWCLNVFMVYQCLTSLQMFSGQIPFYAKIYDFEIIYSVLEGKRPARPLHALSKTRGLSDEVWSIIETCWSQEPAQRPTAKQVVLQLQALPNLCVDARPPDDFGTNFPSQTLYNHTEHPFSVLSAVNYVILASRSGNLPNSGYEPKDEAFVETSSSPREAVVGAQGISEHGHSEFPNVAQCTKRQGVEFETQYGTHCAIHDRASSKMAELKEQEEIPRNNERTGLEEKMAQIGTIKETDETKQTAADERLKHEGIQSSRLLVANMR